MKMLKTLAVLVAAFFAIKYRKVIKNTAAKLVEQGKSKVMQAKAWLSKVR